MNLEIHCSKCGLIIPPDFVKIINTGEMKLEHFAITKPCECGCSTLYVERKREAA